MRSPLLLLCAALAACSGASSDDSSNASEGADPTGPATIMLQNGQGADVGRVSVTEDSTGVTLRIEASGLKPGPHGVHIHTVGRCNGPDFESAGPHWNPTGKQHGRDNPKGAHLGDLANLDAGPDGRTNASFLVAGQRLRDGQLPIVDLDGAAIVIHERADDYKTDPSGASGDRVACAVLPG